MRGPEYREPGRRLVEQARHAATRSERVFEPLSPAASGAPESARVNAIEWRASGGPGKGRGLAQARPAVVDKSTGSTPMRAMALCHLAS